MTDICIPSRRIVRSVVEERPLRPPIIGKIRPGIKVLTAEAQSNKRAAETYREMVQAGDSFDRIEQVLKADLGLVSPLRPDNTPYFNVRPGDFTNGRVAQQLLDMYGTDEDGSGVKRLWRFPAVFLFDDWLSNFPNQMVVWTASAKQYFAEYVDNVRYCKQFAPAEMKNNKAIRQFGPRKIILRSDEHIPDGVCNPYGCPQFQDDKCKLHGSLFFAVRGIKGAGLIELPTDSIIALLNAQSVFETAMAARGRLSGIEFTVTKKLASVRFINRFGKPERRETFVISLDCGIDIADRMLSQVSPAAAMLEANRSAEILQGKGDANTSVEIRTDADDALTSVHEQLSAVLRETGLSNESLQLSFKLYAHDKYGQGWVKDPVRVLAVVDDLNAAKCDLSTLLHNITSKARAIVAETK